MPAKPAKSARTLTLDGDKLGFIAGGVVALGVSIVQMFMRDADPLTTLVRGGWAFVGAYAGVFFLVRMILRTTLFEVLADKEAKREARRSHMREERDKAASRKSAAEPQERIAAAAPRA
jgi:hypothetical protein